MNSALPARSEPTGAESPFDKQNITESNGSAISPASTPSAAAALKILAPSRWHFSPDSFAAAHSSFESCARRYYYAYYGANEDPEVKRLKDLSALPLWAGSVVHEAIERFLKGCRGEPTLTEQEALVQATVHDVMVAQWRESEAGPGGFRLFEHEYQVPVEYEDKKIAVDIVRGSLRAFFRSPTLAEALGAGRERWLTVEDLVSFHVGEIEVYLRMDRAFRNREGRVVIVDWKTGRSERPLNSLQVAG